MRKYIFIFLLLIASTAMADKTQEGIWVEKGKDAVREKLVDPNSADFKDVFFHRGTSDMPAVCGQVNSKNRMGGYTGYTDFISVVKMTLFVSDFESQAEFNKAWNKMCVL